ncbi:hypothetical protein CHS0354_034474 [Potamilus streckersoni]|uniref:Tetratricopeptide repeat protein 38 n=1 Tax=Potamilus streckersoni TaxID=2493646 RepID=A0AAE0W6J1_9BIVA|nr:hypothetical protein CHS0354_034474 [Potamilus streckersoni]
MSWKDAQQWRAEGLPLTTPSDEACKMFDATVTQIAKTCEDPTVGGTGTTLQKMLEADPNFVLGLALKNHLSRKKSFNDAKYAAELDQLVALAEKQNVTSREKLHVQAIKLQAEGEGMKACQVWERILVDHPHDILALRFAYMSYLVSGQSAQIRDTVCRVLPQWNISHPLYGYLLGLYAFGLEETNLFDQAEKTAKKALELNRQDSWATHSMTHVMESMGRTREGETFLSATESDWAPLSHVTYHLYWHWSLYNIEEGNFENALSVFDSKIASHLKNSGSWFTMTDATSILYRLEFEGVNVGDRWKTIYDFCVGHPWEHTWAFEDAHLLIGCSRGKDQEKCKQVMNSLKDFAEHGQGDMKRLTSVSIPLLEAIQCYEAEDYAGAIDILLPIRYNIIQIGGSHAQRDVFNLLLLHAAIKSKEPVHHKIARSLLMERRQLKEKSPMVDRLLEKVQAAISAES